MDLAAVIESVREALSTSLLSLQGLELTAGGLITLALCSVLGAWAGRAVRRLIRNGLSRLDVEPPSAKLVVRLGGWAVLLLGVALGVQLAGLLDLRQAAVLAHQAFRGELFVLGGTPVSLATMATFGLILLATWWASKGIRKAARAAILARDPRATGTVGVMDRLVHYLVVLFGLGVGLQTMGFDLGALIAAGAVFAVGLGLALQSLAQNFVSGVILLVERSIKPGDVLEVEGRVVRIVETRIRSTIARTLDDEDIIVPNGALVQNAIKNYTLTDRLYRVRVGVGVAYGSDLDQVFVALSEAGEKLPERVEDRAPTVLLLGFGSSSIDFELSVWIRDPWQMQRVKSNARLEIWRALKRAGLVIAFPQVDVHLDAPVVQALEKMRRVA